MFQESTEYEIDDESAMEEDDVKSSSSDPEDIRFQNLVIGRVEIELQADSEFEEENNKVTAKSYSRNCIECGVKFSSAVPRCLECWQVNIIL